MCDNPNTLVTKCWRKFYNKFELSSCVSPNHVNCGFFCASSKLQCAKVDLEITSSVTLFLALITGGINLGSALRNPAEDTALILELEDDAVEMAEELGMSVEDYIKACIKFGKTLANSEATDIVTSSYTRQLLATNSKLIGVSLFSTTLMGIVQVVMGETFNCNKIGFIFLSVHFV